MKRFSWAVLLLFFGISAQGQDTEKVQLVQQMQSLKAAVLSADKQQVAAFFQFPIKDNNLKRKIEFNGVEEVKIKTLDRKQLLKYYHKLFTPQLQEMFRQLDFTKLSEQDELIIEIVPKSTTGHCTYRYKMVVINNKVTVSYLLNTRHDKQVPDDEFCEEYAEFWTFEMIKGKLKFKGIELAG